MAAGLSAEHLLTNETPEARESKSRAVEFLEDRLAPGKVAARDIIDEGERHGISSDQPQRARTKLGVMKVKDGFKKGVV